MQRSLVEPQGRQAVSPHGGTAELQLFDDIAANELALIAAIANVRVIFITHNFEHIG